MEKCFVLLASLGLFACAKPIQTQEILWSSRSPATEKPSYPSQDFRKTDMTVQAGSETIVRSFQRVGDAEIEGQYLQKIYDQTGELKFFRGSFVDRDLSFLKKDIGQLATKKYELMEMLKRRLPAFREASFYYDPKIIVKVNGFSPKAALAFDFITKDDSKALRIEVLPSGTHLPPQSQGSSFAEGSGLVFPFGPKWSSLVEKTLDLTGSGFLVSERLEVNTKSDKPAFSKDHHFNFPEGDPRFDQVQVFYFAQQVMRYFEDQAKVALPFKLTIATHLGYPKKVNANFYHQGQIRIGEGDGETWKNLMRDPTVVMHETSHAFIDALAHLPLDGNEGASLNEGFADFFAGSVSNNPHMGDASYIPDPFRRNLENSMNFSQINGSKYGDSLLVSGTLWQLRKTLGEKKAFELAVKTLIRLGPGGNFKSFAPSLSLAAASLNFSAEEQKSINDILVARQWPL